MIKIIIFDLGNVILNFDIKPISERLSAISGRPAAEIHSFIFQTDLEPMFDKGKISPESFFERIKSKFSLNIGFNEFVPIWGDIFKPVPGMEDLIDRLSKTHKLALLSNTNILHFEYARKRYPVIERFTTFHLSCRMGCRKPEPEIFQKVIDFHGCAPENIFYTDDIREFVNAAAAMGITAVHFQGADKIAGDLLKAGVVIDAQPVSDGAYENESI